MRDIIRRLIRLIRIRWREYRRPVESLQSIAHRRIAAVDWKHQMDLAAFAFDMAPYPHPQKLICGPYVPPPTEKAYLITEWVPVRQTICPNALDAAMKRAEETFYRQSVMDFILTKRFQPMTSYEIALATGDGSRVRDVEFALSELASVDDRIHTGNIGTQRAYYFK